MIGGLQIVPAASFRLSETGIFNIHGSEDHCAGGHHGSGDGQAHADGNRSWDFRIRKKEILREPMTDLCVKALMGSKQ